jgi:hypothetical protein
MFVCLKRVPVQEIERCKASSEYARNYISGVQGDSEILNLKESWDGLHYLLSPARRKPANVWDTSVVNLDLMGMAIVGKEHLNKELKLGFSIPKWIDPDQVQAIAKQFSSVGWEELEDAYDPPGMHKCGVYPDEIWDDEDKGRKYLKYWFLQLVKFYKKAAAEAQAVVFFMKV